MTSEDTPPVMKNGARRAGRESRPRCGAKRRQGDGEPCKRGAGQGTAHVGSGRCDLHGGNTPSHVAAAEVTEARQALARVAPAFRPVDDPLSEFKNFTGRVMAWLDLAEEKARAVEAWTVGESAVPRGELVMLRGFMAECRQTLTAFAGLKIDDRLAAVEQAKLAGQLERMRLGLDAYDRVLVLSAEQRGRRSEALQAMADAVFAAAGEPRAVEGRAS